MQCSRWLGFNKFSKLVTARHSGMSMRTWALRSKVLSLEKLCSIVEVCAVVLKLTLFMDTLWFTPKASRMSKH